ncbi:MAG: chemoreceptor glutamine deamidase CheD [Crocinitomicaceae bacterium]|nr:chemoreceptor glutamine deamidase CheD [Crocinitomicaceae bacterium]
MSQPALISQPSTGYPEALDGFDHINRYWDKRLGVYAAKILPGQFYVSVAGEMVVTVLGSCVSACIRDKVNGVGGMNHFMLPVQSSKGKNVNVDFTDAARYGNWAMEFLINEVLKNGGARKNLEVKLFGGGRVLAGMDQMDVGRQNIEFIRHYLDQENIAIKVEDLGGEFPRKVLYFSDTGSVKVRKLKTTSNNVVYEREICYAKEINKKQTQGEIELF